MKKWIAAGSVLLMVLIGALVLMPDPRQPKTPGVPAPAASGQPGAPAAGPGNGMPWSAGQSPGTAAPPPSAGATRLPADSAAPWLSGPQAGATAPAADQTKQQRLAELQVMQADLLRQTQQGKQPDPAQVDEVLARLQEIEGSPMVAGVNIPAVRSNLKKAQQLQQLAQQIENEAKKPGGGDMNRLREQMAQLQQIQAQLQADVSAGQPGAPAPVMPATPVPATPGATGPAK